MAVTCFWPTSVTKSGGTGALGGPSNSRVVNALPSVNNTIVTDFEPSGEFPDTVVPRGPTSAGPGVPLTEPPSAAFAESSALAAAEGSGRIRMVSPITWLPSGLLNVVATPATPFGFCIGGLAVKISGALISVALISSPV